MALDAMLTQAKHCPHHGPEPTALSAYERIEKLEQRIREIANDCNCRAEHGANGAEHLLVIEKWLRELLA